MIEEQPQKNDRTELNLIYVEMIKVVKKKADCETLFGKISES